MWIEVLERQPERNLYIKQSGLQSFYPWDSAYDNHPSSLCPNRRKAFGGPGGDDAVGGGAQKGKLKFECTGPKHCQSVQQLCLRQAFPGLRLWGAKKDTLESTMDR